MLEGDDKGGGLLDAFLAASDEADKVFEADQTEGAAEAQEPEEEVEAEAEASEEAEGAEEGAEESEADDYVELTDDEGNTSRVSLNELVEAHRKLQGIGSSESQIRQEITEAAARQVQDRMQRLDETVGQALQSFQLVQQLVPRVKEPDPVMLDRNSPYYNPQAYREQAEAVRQVKEIMGQAEGQLKETLEKRQAAAREQAQMDMDRHWISLQKADESWTKGDPVKRLTGLRNEVTNLYGFKPEEIAAIYDHRFVLMVQDALSYRKAQKTALKAQPKAAPKLVRAASAKGTKSPQSKRKAQANAALRKTGRVTDLEAVWGEFLD